MCIRDRFWIKEIDYSGKPEAVPLSLDTQEYIFERQGETYQFLAKGSEKPEVSSSRPEDVYKRQGREALGGDGAGGSEGVDLEGPAHGSVSI